MEKRNVALNIILSIITCGIYSLYWLATLTEDTNKLSDKNEPSGGIAVVLTIITCGIYSFYWAYIIGSRIDEIKKQKGIESNNSGILYLIISLIGFGIVTQAIAQNEINNLIEQSQN